jgi:saccharopine dehydrogenase-like NADP-dependent oxidoreductase
VDGAKTTVAALDGLKPLRWTAWSTAFNTSGGLGTLTETLAGRARQVDYKSIRYPGHCAILKLLLNDLRLREQRDLLKEIFEGRHSHDRAGRDRGVRQQHRGAGWPPGAESHSSRILGCEVDGHRLSAIQRTTAAGICAALDLVAQGKLPQQGFVGQEQVALTDFLANRFGSVYATQPETCAEACAVSYMPSDLSRSSVSLGAAGEAGAAGAACAPSSCACAIRASGSGASWGQSRRA